MNEKIKRKAHVKQSFSLDFLERGTFTEYPYVGYAVTQSVWGAVLATVAVCLPSFILVLLISYFFAKCKDNKYIKAAMSGLLPMSVALIASAALLMMNRENFIDYKSIGIFAAAFLVTWKWNLHPILLICLAGVVGLLLY